MILFLLVLLSDDLLLKFSLSLLEVMISSLLLKLGLLVLSLGLGLLGDNSLDKNLLVLVDVTLGKQVKLLIHLALELSLGSVLFEESSESPLSSDPDNLGWHSSIGASPSLSDSHVSSLSLLGESFEGSESGVDFDISLSDKSVLDEGSDVGSGGGARELFGLGGVEPDSVLSALQN